jgi:hypothetical protein
MGSHGGKVLICEFDHRNIYLTRAEHDCSFVDKDYKPNKDAKKIIIERRL